MATWRRQEQEIKKKEEQSNLKVSVEKTARNTQEACSKSTAEVPPSKALNPPVAVGAATGQ